MTPELFVGALLLTVTHLGLIFLGLVLIVVSPRIHIRCIGWVIALAGLAGVFFSIYEALSFRAG